MVPQLHKVQLRGIRNMQHGAPAGGYKILLEGKKVIKYEHKSFILSTSTRETILVTMLIWKVV